MWSRIVECMLGCWMLISPFIFAHAPHETALWTNDLTTGLVLILLSLASYWRPMGWAHWAILIVGVWLVAFGRLQQSPPLPAALQNDIVVGLLLVMFAIIPNDASTPPESWNNAGPTGNTRPGSA